MNEITAQLNNYRASPRKIRLVANAIKGKKITEAKNILQFMAKRGAAPIHKLLNSAISNAKNLNAKAENLYVKSVSVNAGAILYRRRPAAHGASHTVRKRVSKVKIILGEK